LPGFYLATSRAGSVAAQTHIMRYISLLAILAIWITIASFAFAETAIVAPNAVVGCNLQKSATLTLDEPAPDEGLDITLKSSDPGRLLIARAPDQPGAASVVIRVRQGYRDSPEFWLRAIGSEGTVSYSAAAAGFLTGNGTVTLSPAAIGILGPLRAPRFFTTTGAAPSKITLFSARLDSAFKFVEEQPVAPGSVRVDVISSNKSVGTIASSPLEIRGGMSSAVTLFRPVGEGETTLSIGVPSGFSALAKFSAISASVRRPGLAISDQLVIGENLQVGGVLSLGKAAPLQGVNVTLVSDDSSQLLLSTSANEIGSKAITLEIPAYGTYARYYLQALGKSGTITYTATAPEYRSRTAIVSLAPSGIVITPASQGAPDEAQVLRDEPPESTYTLMVNLSKRAPVSVIAWTVQLDPVTHRSADITVQPLRHGLSLTVPLANSNPAVGTILSEVTIVGGSDHSVAEFRPITAGETEISVTTPKDFTPSANSTTVRAVVRH
jgi:hypothetical protein